MRRSDIGKKNIDLAARRRWWKKQQEKKPAKVVLDLTGQVFGVWKVLSRAPKRNKYGAAIWKCVCLNCGHEGERTGGYLRQQMPKSCENCYDHGRKMPHDLTGMTFGQWLVIGPGPTKKYGRNNNNDCYTWECRCSCGRERVVSRQELIRGRSTRCTWCANEENVQRKRDNGDYHKMGYQDNGLTAAWNKFRYQARIRGLEQKLTKQQWKELVYSDCFYCQRKAELSTDGRNGIDRYDNDYGYCERNAVPCCEKHNRRKLETHGDDYCREIVEGPSLLP